MGSPSPPSPTLPFAVKALRNAVLQCGQQLGAAQLSSLTAAEYANLLTSASNGTLSSTDEHAMQLHTVQRLSLLHLSWCALESADYVPALSWASQERSPGPEFHLTFTGVEFWTCPRYHPD